LNKVFYTAVVSVHWTQSLDGCISLKFLLETRLESMPFETLIDFLAFLVHNL